MDKYMKKQHNVWVYSKTVAIFGFGVESNCE